jgi:hypothetical protein
MRGYLGSKHSPASADYPTSCYTFFLRWSLSLPRYPSTRYPVPSVLCYPSLLSVGGVPISSGNENPSDTNHGGCFASSTNHRRTSVFRKEDAGPISPRGRRGALLILVGALRPCHSLPWGEQLTLLHDYVHDTSLPNTKTKFMNILF